MTAKDTFFSKKQSLNCNGKLLDLSDPKIMAIVNITPDSFYDGGRYTQLDNISKRVQQVLSEGADIIDVGAYSSRPGAKHIDEKEEWERLAPVLGMIRKNYPEAVVSLDTFRSDIARKAVKEFHVDIINDIAAGEMDENMFDTIADLNVPYIMMHMQGTPQNMQMNPTYDHLIKDMMKYFSEKVDQLTARGICDIIIDPGFGFGKTLDHNYQLMHHLSDFSIFKLPVLVGVSRKSMIYKYFDITPDEALNGTSVLNTIAVQNGADILRVHDVKEAKQVVDLVKKTECSKVEKWYE